MDNLEDYRDAPSTPRAIKAAANAALDKLKEYYSGAGIEVYAAATILDPHLKLDYYHDNEWEEKWIKEAWDAFSNAYARYRVPPKPDVRGRPSTELGGKVGGGDDNYDEDAISAAHMYKRRRTAERDELQDYLKLPPVTPETDTLQWWKVNAAAYPGLAAMARDYLAIPATGAPVERVFSGGTDLVQPKRGALGKTIIKICMCLKSWLKLLKMR